MLAEDNTQVLAQTDRPLVGKRASVEMPQVTFVGKTATFGLYFFLPLSYLAYGHSPAWHAVGVWGSAISAVVYWYAGLGYVADVARRRRRSA